MGLLEGIFDNNRMFLNPRYGHVGLFAIPFYFFTEVVPPFIELAGYAVILAGLFLNAVPSVNIVHFLVKLCASFLDNLFYRS
jgi:hypothetical protein